MRCFTALRSPFSHLPDLTGSNRRQSNGTFGFHWETRTQGRAECSTSDVVRLEFQPFLAIVTTNMNRDLKKYLKLHTALVNEKARIEARLAEIAQVLGQDVSVPAASTASATPTTTTKGRRKFSEATKAKMRASQQARWAKKRGNVAVKADVDAATAPAAKPAKKRKKTKMSAAGRAAIVAAQKARWAAIKAKKAESK